MIKVTNVTKHYGTFRALDAVEFHVQKGECIAMLGSNGSGKSTLFRCILGIVPFDGTITVDGKDSFAHGKQVRSTIGYMPQQVALHNDLTISQTLQFYTELRRARLNETYAMLERVELSELEKVRVGELSGGMKQRLSIVVALIGDPKVLLLDEPTVSMDYRSQQILVAWLRELKEADKSILLSTHLRQDLLSLADRSLTLDHGQLLLPQSHATHSAIAA